MDFLLEIGTEEIPARMIDNAREELARRVRLLLEREAVIGRNEEPSAIEAYSTPRRLAVLVRHVADKQVDDTSLILGPSRRSPSKTVFQLPPLKLSRVRKRLRLARFGWR